jgi:pyridoxine/pyridoxamine 5'-phosphate oxidase
MNPEGILDFIRTRRLAVVATVSDNGLPEAALVGIAVTNDERIVFDTVKGSRKYANLRRRIGIALVVGWEDEVTVQLEGIGEEPTGIDLAYCKEAYFVAHPNGRERQDWPDIAYIAMRITWMRYCDYAVDGVGVVEHTH